MLIHVTKILYQVNLTDGNYHVSFYPLQNAHAYVNAAFRFPMDGLTITGRPSIVLGGINADTVRISDLPFGTQENNAKTPQRHTYTFVLSSANAFYISKDDRI